MNFQLRCINSTYKIKILGYPALYKKNRKPQKFLMEYGTQSKDFNIKKHFCLRKYSKIEYSTLIILGTSGRLAICDLL